MARTKLPRKSKRLRNSKNINETKVDIIKANSAEANEKLAALQMTVNQHLYDIAITIYSEIQQNTESKDAIGIIISALCTNLGIILAQIPENSRDAYLVMASTIVQKSLTASLETLAEQTHGVIGHA
jgi:hypothetical protein